MNASVKQRSCLTRIQFALFCNIASDDVGGDTDGGDEISFRPNPIGTPVVLVEYGKLVFDFPSGVGLHEANHGANSHLGRYGNEEMNMILVVVRLFDIQLRVVVGDFKQFPIEILPEFWRDDGMAVFGRKDDVIVTKVYTVIVPSIRLFVCHPSMVYGGWRIRYGNSLHPRAYAARGIYVE